MGQGPTRVHPLPKSHFQQQSWIKETFWAPRGADASCTFFRPVPAGRDGWGRQTDGRYLLGAAGGTRTCFRGHYHQWRTQKHFSLSTYYRSLVQHAEWHTDGEQKRAGNPTLLIYQPMTQMLSLTHSFKSFVISIFSFENTKKVACVQLINTIVLTPDDLDFPLHLRNVFMRVGLADLIDVRKPLKRQTTHFGNLIIS